MAMTFVVLVVLSVACDSDQAEPSVDSSASSAPPEQSTPPATLDMEPEASCESIDKALAQEAVGGGNVKMGYSHVRNSPAGVTSSTCSYRNNKTAREVSFGVSTWNARRFAAKKRRDDTSYKKFGTPVDCSRERGIFGEKSYTSRCVWGDPVNSVVVKHAVPAGDAAFTCQAAVPPDDEAGVRKRVDAFCRKVARALSS